MYHFFDITFSCDFPLPELPESDSTVSSFSVVLDSPKQYSLVGFQKSFEWCDDSGRAICLCERRNDEYLFIYPGYARYHISAAGIINCLILENSSMQEMRHLLLNQIIPRYLATLGMLVLHASAVRLENGKSVAFLGNSGVGKSTLASSFHRNGAKLISDDCILLKPIEDGVTVIGGFKGIRLFPDSLTAVFSEVNGFTHYTSYSDKQQFILKNETDSTQYKPNMLSAIFLLNVPRELEKDDRVLIEPISGSTALLAMDSCAFCLDPSDQQMIICNFRNIGKTISSNLGLYSLQYPRKHEQLCEVREVIEECMRA